MTRRPSEFGVARRVREYAARADRAEFTSTWTLPGGRRAVVCGLCRRTQMSPKSWSRRGGLCLSCSMRGDTPRWVETSGGAVTRWRQDAGLTQEEMARLCGWEKARQCRLEKQPRVNGQTARSLANGFARAVQAGASGHLLAREWPLFCLLADEDVVIGAIEDAEVPPDLE